ncbi:MAG: hypothetical protein IKP48_11415 [Bacteroidaceae bacterium]|nr:hypothetical protein [Bacteroidaceae bacterium]
MKKTAAIGWAILLLCSACENRLEESYALAEIKPIAQTLTLQQFNALFDEASTRTQLEGRSVLWTAGDKVRVFGNSKSGGYHSEVFTTQETGACVTFSSDNPIQTDADFYAFYPAEQTQGLVAYYDDESEKRYAVNILLPSSQVAIPDGIENQLNISYAKTEGGDIRNLLFHNLCSLIKFEVTGSGVGNLKRVRLTANNDADNQAVYLSGEMLVNVDDGDIFTVEDNNYVELVGDFEELHTYYILCAPTEMPKGFTLSMFNDEGKEYTLSGLNAANLHPSEMLNLGTIQVDSDDYTNGWAMQYSVNNSNHPVSWVVIPEGFTRDQLADYHSRATEMLDFIFDVEPFNQYQSYFNIHILDAVSEEEGADVTDTGSYVNTFFDAGWALNSFNNMKANSQRVFSFVEAHNPDILSRKVSIDETGIIMLINDSRYAGISFYWSYGKSYAMVPVTQRSDGSNLKWSGNGSSKVTCEGTWLNTALHEAGGHMFGRLADEYIGSATYTGKTIPGHNLPVPYGLNVTADKENNLLWSDFIPNTQGIMQTGKFLHVGTYEGGYGAYGKGIWRSEEVSCMDDNRPYFSAWQRYLIAKRIHDLAQEPFTYDDFIANDNQYINIQAGVQFAGTEGKLTTIFVPEGIRYNDTSLAPRLFLHSAPNDILPPLPPPVLMENE